MIQLPDFSKAWEYENSFYLSCAPSRFGKFLAHWELYKMIHKFPGSLIECGVFKGASFVRFATFLHLFGASAEKKLIGFDTFGVFPTTNFEADRELRERLVQEAGEQSISKEQLLDVLTQKGIAQWVECVEGNILETVPRYVAEHLDLKISLLNLDTDLYEPAQVILKYLWPKIIKGGVLILDDYGVFPGETKAVDEYFKGQSIKIQKFDYSATPCFIVKE